MRFATGCDNVDFLVTDEDDFVPPACEECVTVLRRKGNTSLFTCLCGATTHDIEADQQPTMEEQCELFDHPLMGHACPCGKRWVSL